MIKLNTKTVQVIKDDKTLFVKIQASLGISEKTMYDYVNKNSPNLTKLAAIDAIVSHTGQPLSELIDGGKMSKLLAR